MGYLAAVWVWLTLTFVVEAQLRVEGFGCDSNGHKQSGDGHSWLQPGSMSDVRVESGYLCFAVHPGEMARAGATKYIMTTVAQEAKNPTKLYTNELRTNHPGTIYLGLSETDRRGKTSHYTYSMKKRPLAATEAATTVARPMVKPVTVTPMQKKKPRREQREAERRQKEATTRPAAVTKWRFKFQQLPLESAQATGTLGLALVVFFIWMQYAAERYVIQRSKRGL